MKTNLRIILILSFLFSGLALTAKSHASAIELIKDGYKDVFLRNDEGAGAAKVLDRNDKTGRYIYEEPALETLSHTYWALDLYSLDDDEAIDNFMWINECDIFKTYYADQFEWKEIRNATRDFLAKNKEEFPTRFEFVIPIFLQDYDTRLRAFEVQKRYALNSIRRFEVVAKNADLNCEVNLPGRKNYYPPSMLLEFSRPFNLLHIPMSRERADDYIKEKHAIMMERLKGRTNKNSAYKFREAFLVIKVNMFARGETLKNINSDGYSTIQLLSILEGFEVYLDYERTEMIYGESFVSNTTNVNTAEKELEEQFSILREKAAGEGILR